LLIDHIASALEIVEKAENSSLFRFAERFYPDFKRAAKLAVVFHDSGKIFYQFKRGKEGRRYLSFKGHEYFSTYILSMFANNLLEIDVENYEKDGTLRQICTFAIFFHHHAMNVRLRKPEVKPMMFEYGMQLLDKFADEVSIFLDEVERDAMEKALDVIKSQTKLMSDVEIYVTDEIKNRL
jgi:CRISPR-associated endonuclease Cas3-HD